MTPKVPNDNFPIKLILLITFICMFMFGVMGGLLGIVGRNSDPVSGFLVGMGVGLVILVVSGVAMFGWEWVKKEADKGKLLPYILMGFIAAIVISSFLAMNLGKPSCEESSEEPYSSCLQYADDGYETTNAQKWDKFWGTLPITVIIASLIAVIVRNEKEKNKKK